MSQAKPRSEELEQFRTCNWLKGGGHKGHYPLPKQLRAKLLYRPPNSKTVDSQFLPAVVAMETISHCGFRSLSISRAPISKIPIIPFSSILTSSSSSSFSLHLRNSVFSCKNPFLSPAIIPFAAHATNSDSSSSQEFALLLEVEGVLADIYRLGNRQAFNEAFKKLGLDCANWTDPIYLDLARKAGGDEKRMLAIFFNRIGWPTSLPTSEKESFMESVLREKKNALLDLVMAKGFSLRPGVENFIDDACNEGIPLVILTPYSKNGDKVARAIIEKLGHERISKVKIVGKEEMEGSFYGQLVLGKGVSSSLDEQIAKEARKAASVEKQRIAQEVASMLKLSVEIENVSTENLEKIVATLHAGAEYADLPVQSCVLVAGSQCGLLGAERIGMPCVVLRNSLTARAEFPSANAVLDGFGGADLTVSGIQQKRWS